MARDFYDSVLGAAYSAYAERPRLARPIGRLVWAGDFAPVYRQMAAISAAPAGATIVDCPCGAGPALRALRPGTPVRYLGFDRSPAMLRRARERVAVRGLEAEVELAAGDATALPLADDSADLFLSLWGLHCFDDPAAAIAEAGRVLRPGGRLECATFLRGDETWRQRFFIRPHAAAFGAIPAEAELEQWVGAAGFEDATLRRAGSFAFVSATLPG